jgi:hypothetical protein
MEFKPPVSANHVVESEPEFKTAPASEVRVVQANETIITKAVAFLRSLPLEKAILVPKPPEAKWEAFQARLQSNARNWAGPQRLAKTHRSVKDGGVWIWWEANKTTEPTE